MKIDSKSKVTYELWLKPGDNQTIEDLLEKFKGRVVEVRDGMVCVVQSEVGNG